MKIKGKKIEGPNIEIIILPRGNEDLVFKAQAVLDTSAFDQLCPRPEPPKMMKRGGQLVSNVEDPGYQQAIQAYGKLRSSWMIIQSLRATDDLEWETVKYDDSSTWNGYEDELRKSGFAEMEISRLITGVMTANALNEDKIEEARNRFFAGQQAAAQTKSSPEAAPNNTPSGEPAKDSV